VQSPRFAWNGVNRISGLELRCWGSGELRAVSIPYRPGTSSCAPDACSLVLALFAAAISDRLAPGRKQAIESPVRGTKMFFENRRCDDGVSTESEIGASGCKGLERSSEQPVLPARNRGTRASCSMVPWTPGSRP